MSEDLNPEEFNIDDWIKGAKRPERSVTVYQRPDLIGDLDVLEEQIKAYKETGEEALGDSRESLIEEYENTARLMEESKLVVRVKGLDGDDRKQIEKKSKKSDDSVKVGFAILAEAIVSPKMTPAQVEAFEAAIGQGQMGRILAKFQEATAALPKVSPDFLRRPSGRGNGRE